MRQLPDFRLETFFAKWEFEAEHHMTASDAQSMPLGELLALANDEERNAWNALPLGYTQTQGEPRLRDAIAGTYERISRDDVLCFAGAEEGLWCALNAMLEPGDHAIVTVPNYQSMETVPLSLCAVSGVALRPENGWRLDPDDVRSALRPETKLLAINFPNNPTGALLDPSTFAEIVALAAERNVYVFSDEVYRGLEPDESLRVPHIADAYERGVSLGGMSKVYGLPGVRVGWVATRNRELLRRMDRIKHYLSICNAAPSELLARIALRNAERILARNRHLCAHNVAQLDAFFARHAELYEWRAPQGGCIAFPRYRGEDGVERHCAALLRQAGVLLLPASLYQSQLGHVPDDRFRVGFGRAEIERGLRAWDDFLTGPA